MNKINEKIIRTLIKKKKLANQEANLLTRQIAGAIKQPPPSKIVLLKTYRQLVKQKKIKAKKSLEKILMTREIRTLSGVAPIAVLTKPYPCPGKCIYCPSQKNIPKSYLDNEPAVMRAVLCQFDPYRQVQMRLQALKITGHSTDKVELIIMGGTWSALPKKYQTWFIKRCFDGLNNKTSKTIARAQKINERTKHRCVGLTLETRPDFIDIKEIKRIRQLGATRVELGVQSIDDKILQYNQRGHNIATTIIATKLLKDAGFKISYHLMPNLPGATPTKDLAMFKKIFSNQNFQPDLIKIYPCVVVRGSKLYRWWQKKKFQPYTDQQLKTLLIKIKKIIPPYVRITRLIRDIPSISIEDGNKISNLRQIIQTEMTKQGLTCQCIRCREARQQQVDIKKIKFVTKQYPASDGQEYFLSYESLDKKILYAFLRLRFPYKTFIPELADTAIIREVHTYGQLIPLNKKGYQAVQHLGLGKKLMAQAEQLAHKNGYKKMSVIAGIGVREYYEKLGYCLEGTYMTKRL